MIPPSETRVFFGEKVPWLNKLVESLLLQQAISKQTADVELSRLHFGQGEVIVDVKGMISKRFPKPYACHVKKFFSQQDEAFVVFRLESPKKNAEKIGSGKTKGQKIGERLFFNPGKLFVQPQGYFSTLDWTKRVTFTLGPSSPSSLQHSQHAFCLVLTLQEGFGYDHP